jgi:hypothetical protein
MLSRSTDPKEPCIETPVVGSQCFGITREKASDGVTFSAEHVDGCLSSIRSDIDFGLKLCKGSVVDLESVLWGAATWASTNSGFESIGGAYAFEGILENVWAQEAASPSTLRSITEQFALALLDGDLCVPDSMAGCTCCCSAIVKGEKLRVTARRIVAPMLRDPIRHTGLEYPSFTVPEVAHYLPDFNRLSPDVCESTWFYSTRDFGVAFDPSNTEDLVSGVIGVGVAPKGPRKGLKDALEKEEQALNSSIASLVDVSREVVFQADIGSNDNKRACVAWNEDAIAWSNSGCRETKFSGTVVTCTCSSLQSSAFGVTVLTGDYFPSYVTASSSLVIVASGILLLCSVLVPKLSKSLSGTVMKHVASSSMLANLAFLVNILTTRNAGTTAQFVLGLLTHYVVLAFISVLGAAMFNLWRYTRNSSGATAAKGSFAAFVSAWLLPVLIVIVATLFGSENYDAREDVYADVLGNDRISLVPKDSFYLFFASLLAEFVLLFLASIIFIAGLIQTEESGSADLSADGKAAEASGLSRNQAVATGLLIMWHWVPPLLIMVSVATGEELVDYLIAVTFVIQALGQLVYCAIAAEPNHIAEVRPGTGTAADMIPMKRYGAGSPQQPDHTGIVVNNVAETHLGASGATPGRHSPGERSQAWQMLDLSTIGGGMSQIGDDEQFGQAQYSPGPSAPGPHASPGHYIPGRQVEKPTFIQPHVDATEFDDLIFSLNTDTMEGNMFSLSPHAVSPFGNPVSDRGAARGVNRFSIADTHL